MFRWLPLLLVVGCTNPVRTLRTDLEGVVQDDTEWLLRLAEEVDVAAAAMPPQDATDVACGDSWPSCSICLSLDGSQAAGGFDAAAESLPCVAGGYDATVEAWFTIDALALAGTWAGESDAYAISATGTREADLRLDTPARGERRWDTSMELDRFDVETDRGDLDGFDLVWTYPRFDGAWTVDLTGDRVALTGVVGNADTSCAISGSPLAVVVDCP